MRYILASLALIAIVVILRVAARIRNEARMDREYEAERQRENFWRPTTTYVTTPEELDAAMDAARDGGRILLLRGADFTGAKCFESA